MSLIEQAASLPDQAPATTEGHSEQTRSASPAESSTAHVPLHDQSRSGDQEGRMEDAWYWDEDIKGNKNRPEWLNGKYKSVAEQAKAYNEAQKRLGAFKGAPQEYDLALKDYPDVKFQQNDPYINDFLESAKKNNVSQEYVSDILNHYVKMQMASRPNIDKELEKLGPSAKQDIQSLGNWANNNLTGEEINVFKSMITTADSVRLFEKIRRLVNRADTSPTSSAAPRDTLADARAAIHDPRYNTDEGFRNKVRERLAQLSE